MSSPRLEDDVAFFGYERCESCAEHHDPDDWCGSDDDPDMAWECMMDK